MIRTKFWGVRGSIPVPGATTVGVGGNTSCVQVMCGDTHIVFDAGTGLRLLGAELVRKMPVSVHLFISHVHWDHIQGFPFFAPAFVGGNKIHMYGASNSRGTVESAMAGQMEFPNFPVKLSELGSELIFHHVSPGDVVHVGADVSVRAAAGTHPGGVLAYRVDYEGASVVYATDTEHSDDGAAHCVQTWTHQNRARAAAARRRRRQRTECPPRDRRGGSCPTSGGSAQARPEG